MPVLVVQKSKTSKPDKVVALKKWPSNAELVVDVHRMGYLNDDDFVLDPTFGEGVWWQLWRPARLVCLNRNFDGTDFRNLPWPDEWFDAIAYDPPYVSKGSRTKTTLGEKQRRYGLEDAPKSPGGVQQLMDDGLTEMVRLVKPARRVGEDVVGGIILMKCMDYVSGGHVWPGVYKTMTHAFSLGLEYHDRFEMETDPAVQPERKRKSGAPSLQQHALRNHSTLLAFRKPPAPPARRRNRELQATLFAA